MSSQIKLRIAQVADKLAAVGLRGGNMTDELRKLAASEDLSANEIRLAAQTANRQAQLQLYKLASDKRFKFELADGKKVAEEATKAAKGEPVKTSEFHTRLDAIDAASGDPYAAPVRSNPAALSFFQANVEAKTAAIRSQLDDSELLHLLKRAELDIEAMIREAGAEEARITKIAVDAHDGLTQAAVNMVTHGVTLPSLYDATLAGASGSNSGVDLDSAIEQTDALIRMVISELKKRGIENHKMGFRHNGDPEALSKLDANALIALCKRHSSYQRPQDLTMVDVKTAEALKIADSYIERHPEGPIGADRPMRPDDALDLLKTRSTLTGKFAVPQAYLDDADPLPGGVPRVYNTNDEYIVSVHDLVGAQDRMRRCHAAQEYLGLKLKKLVDAQGAVREARKTADLAIKEGAQVLVADALGQEKDAWIGNVLSAISRPIMSGLVKGQRAVRGLVGSKALNTAKTVGSVATSPGAQAAMAGASLLGGGGNSSPTPTRADD